MMTIGNIKAAVMVVRSIREDWDQRTVTDQVNTLAGEYTHRDVLYACITVAEEPNNRSPVTLSIKAADIIARLHEKTRAPRTPSGGRRDDGFLCDECGKPESKCQTDASNLNGRDHAFISAAKRDADRDQMHADGRIAAARAEAVSKAPANLFAMPADVTNAHPEPAQEEAAS